MNHPVKAPKKLIEVAIPQEAQRLGLEAFASDLNPEADLINKAMIEIPPKFAGRAPVGRIPPDEKQMKMRSSLARRYGACRRRPPLRRLDAGGR